MISGDSRDYERFAAGAMRYLKKHVPGLFPEVALALGAVHQWRREYLEGDKAHSVVGMSERIKKK
jgi:hypothetical protein